MQLTAWYDTDGSGKVSSGDLTGTSSSLIVEDKGFLSDNLTRSPDVALTPVP